MVDDQQFDRHARGFSDLREKLIRILGVSTVNRLIDRSVVEIAPVHPELTLLRCEGDTLVVDGVRQAFREKDAHELDASFMALSGVMILLIARLLGKEVALRLVEGVPIAGVLESRVIGNE